MKTVMQFLPGLALAMLAACSAGEPADNAQATEEQQAEMVENAVRQNYADRGAEVVEIDMARSADGARFAGYATVRDTSNGNELRVYCRYSQGPGGEPALTCTRTGSEENAPVSAPERS